jgi:hypothetical protein
MHVACNVYYTNIGTIYIISSYSITSSQPVCNHNYTLTVMRITLVYVMTITLRTVRCTRYELRVSARSLQNSVTAITRHAHWHTCNEAKRHVYVLCSAVLQDTCFCDAFADTLLALCMSLSPTCCILTPAYPPVDFQKGGMCVWGGQVATTTTQ